MTWAPKPGTRLTFDVLSAKAEQAPPIATVAVVYGPKAKLSDKGRGGAGQWWQMELRATEEPYTAPLCAIRALTARPPLAGPGLLGFARYQVRMPRTGEALEYLDAHSGRALLPAWMDWERQFIPQRVSTGRNRHEPPATCEFLGHVLSLRSVTTGETWEPWQDVKRLKLDRQMLVGTGRNFKDIEGHRLPQGPHAPDYTYTKFTTADYRVMLEAGFNLFTIAPEQQAWVADEPAFYIRSAAGPPPLDFPADLYRANYLGPSMFVDEPASVMTWDKTLRPGLKHLLDVTTLIEKRTALLFNSQTRYYGRSWLEEQLRDRGVNLGGLHLAQLELPIWETRYDRAFYELASGGSGFVHEGRYQLSEFDQAVSRLIGRQRHHTVRQMLQWYFAPLRGSARSLGKCWGTSIYGQCDPAVAPEALATAYDMGARYFWFWTSDHAHHVPWPEQLALARSLKEYARAHPRPSIYRSPPVVDTLILIPDGFFASLSDLAWLNWPNDAEEAGKYHRIVEGALKAAETCFAHGREFDLAIDRGQSTHGYRRVVRVTPGD